MPMTETKSPELKHSGLNYLRVSSFAYAKLQAKADFIVGKQTAEAFALALELSTSVGSTTTMYRSATRMMPSST